MRWPKKLPNHRRVLARIYPPCTGRDSYRLVWKVGGKRQMKSFRTYGGDDGAKKFGDSLVKDLARQTPIASLTLSQANAACAAFGILNNFQIETGHHLSLVTVVSDYCENFKKLRGHSLSEATAGFMRDAVTVQEMPIAKAVEQFIESRKYKAEQKPGKRAQLSASYTKHVNAWLRDFAAAFPGEPLCHLTKEHLNMYLQGLKDIGPKSRNDRRATVRMFLGWAVKNDFLSKSHRLFEADGMVKETVIAGDTDFYRPAELQKLLMHADEEIRPVIAIGGLAGLRVEEIMRLDWADVRKFDGHIAVSALIAKIRQRRLVEICPALAAWLKSYDKKVDGPVFPRGVNAYQRGFSKLRKGLRIQGRDNGLRHAYCTYHFALYGNENLTAAQAGNSPAVIHRHYKGLATKAEAEKWFAIMPGQPPNPSQGPADGTTRYEKK